MKPYVWALQLEAWAKDARRSRGEEAPQPKLKVRGAFDVDAVSFSERLDRLEADFNNETSMVRPEAVVVKAPSAGVAEPSIAARSSEEARLPQSSEHVVQPCSEAKASWPRKQQGSRRLPAVCWRCGQPGHMQRNCGLTIQAPEEVKKLSSAVNRGSHGLDRANVYLRMQLGDRSLPCSLDSGCEVTLIPKPVVEAVRGVVMSPSSQRLWAANGTEIEIVGEVTVPLLLDGRCIDTTALVSPDVEEVILGSDWLQAHTCLWDFG